MILENIRKLLPEAVLVPIPCGRKGPVLKGWTQRRLKDMEDPNYLALFYEGDNIGVSLGTVSGGLCSIDIDSDKGLEEFLGLNPKLQNSLRTKRVRGGNVWVIIKGPFPEQVYKLKTITGEDWGEFRSNGGQTVIHGAAIDKEKGETKPTIYKRIVDAPPIEIEFSEITFPPDVILPWLKETGGNTAFEELKAKFGEPVYFSKKGIQSVNEIFWAGLYASENILVYEPDEREFYVYSAATGLYVPKSEDSIRSEIAARMLEVSRSQPGLEGLEAKRTNQVLTAIVKQLHGHVEKRGAFIHGGNIVHLKNGVIDFSASKPNLEDFSPDFLSRNQIPLNFDPAAECPRFLEFLNIALSPEDQVLVQKLFGQCLLGKNLTQRILIFDGDAGRGKTQLALILQELVGGQNVTQLRTSQLEGRFELYRFLRKTLLSGNDVPSNFLEAKGAHVLKALVGGDLMDAEKKNNNGHFQLKGEFNVIVTSNSRLKVRLQEDSGAWKRRLLIVRFNRPPVAKRIPGLGPQLVRDEGPGILNWAIAGIMGLLEDIRETGDLRLTKNQGRLVSELLEESDSIRSFVKRRIISTPNATITKEEMVEAYLCYCQEQGWKPFSHREVLSELDRFMLEEHAKRPSHDLVRSSGQHRGYKGVGLLK